LKKCQYGTAVPNEVLAPIYTISEGRGLGFGTGGYFFLTHTVYFTARCWANIMAGIVYCLLCYADTNAENHSSPITQQES